MAICLIVIVGLFYAEENWRGKRDWENCKRALKAQGVETDWAKYLPAPIPDADNVFGVPEMQKWFAGNSVGWADFVKILPSPTFPGVEIDSNTTRMVVAKVAIGLPGMSAPDGFAALQIDNPASRTEAAKVLNNAFGPIGKAPQSTIGVGLMLRSPEEVRPAQIFLECQNALRGNELQEFLPDSVIHAEPGLTERVLKFEPDGDGSYRVTMPVLGKASDYLTWSDGLGPQFSLVRDALRRPSVRMPGYYGNPDRFPGPNFRAVRSFAQTLGARAQCHLLLGQPEEASRDLTLLHDFCRILREQKPMTFVAAMGNVAVQEVYATQIAEGLRMHAWRESDLAALQEQLKTIDIIPAVKQAFVMDATSTFRTLESVPSAGLVKRSVLAGLCPSGWGYQHIAARVHLEFDRLASFDANNQIIFPDKVRAADQKAQEVKNHGPYTFVPKLEPAAFFVVACQRAAQVQTQINQALIACALKRYRLAHGQYPENLDALVPHFLEKIPHDVIGGQPPHYRRATDGTFILYSIGWSGLDKGGVCSQSLQGMDGDWIWPD